ncbi:MAG: DUF5996 family protein [Cyclobacteriaceae bacterium]
METPHLPDLPLSAWEDTKMTLHLYVQIVGKIRLRLTPRKNHWWYLTLYVSPKGLTTHAIPYGNETFEITFNFLRHQLELVSSRGEEAMIPLQDGLSVADFYRQLQTILRQWDIEVSIVNKPFDVSSIDKPFDQITEHASYNAEYVERFWRIMLWVDGVFKEFSGRSYSKTCPVHLYWHHMDLTVTRFSGRKGPALTPNMRISDKDAYSHEVISFGFWAGDDTVREPAFYVYAYPSPEGLDQQPIQPAAAQWVDSNGSPMALLMYEALRKEPDPRQALLNFLESTYQAGARLAGWEVKDLTVPPLEDL